jgi:hypothetical protein
VAGYHEEKIVIFVLLLKMEKAVVCESILGYGLPRLKENIYIYLLPELGNIIS